MSSIKLSPNASGTAIFTIEAPATSTNRTLTLPDQTGTVLTNAGPFTANASASAGAVTIDASNNVGVGTSSPAYRLSVAGRGTFTPSSENYAVYMAYNSSTAGVWMGSPAANVQAFYNNAGDERARITSGGTMLIGRTADVSSTTRLGLDATASIAGFVSETGPTTSVTHGRFINGNGTVGSISTNGTATTYSTSSDYRLKEQIQPMVGALAKVAELKPVTYKWKTDGKAGEGFVAHELQTVMPDAVVGEKDAVDAEGKPIYQGIDTSFLVATLTAALQELNAKVEAQAAEIAALKGAQ